MKKIYIVPQVKLAGGHEEIQERSAGGHEEFLYVGTFFFLCGLRRFAICFARRWCLGAGGRPSLPQEHRVGCHIFLR